MMLTELASRYLATHPVGRQTRVQFGTAVRSFEQCIGRYATVDDLQAETLEAWLTALDGSRSESTILHYRQRLTSLWHFAAEEQLCSGPPASPPAPPPPHPEPIPDRRPAHRRQFESSLRDYVDQYRIDHDIKRSSVQSLLAVVSKFEAYLQRTATLSDLTAHVVNSWLASLRDSIAVESIYGYRRLLLTLWRAAHLDELVDEYPNRVRRIKRPERVIDGWDVQQMGQLLAACDKLSGVIRGIKTGAVENWVCRDRHKWGEEKGSRQTRHDGVVYMQIDRTAYFRAFFLTLWDTGVRLGDVLSIERAWITRQPDGSGRFAMIQAKVGRRIERVLRPETLAAIEATFPPERKLLFPIWCCGENFHKALRSIVKLAGLTGTSKFIRRGSSSEVEKHNPGCGKLHLGHSPKSAGLFEQSYAVQRICARTAPLPPAIVPAPVAEIGGAQ